ncbi:ribosomal protein L11 methyltransferase [Mesobacillus boroniphilus JCM 21738]|uniref:Ribosomal protein L11 methyltransferase n=1 Tax=Mesobacillus boroniphilus JCM 21738 TaxID=1294265 RepID=W4RR93_9BACI|nr:ribosomal protein L11 methyltransferase [Mesobacillus boroniphilus JCM 21738]
MKNGGYFITSGIIQQKKEVVKDAMINAGFEIEEIISMEDWVAIISKKK